LRAAGFAFALNGLLLRPPTHSLEASMPATIARIIALLLAVSGAILARIAEN
jgi:hypothetical protein